MTIYAKHLSIAVCLTKHIKVLYIHSVNHVNLMSHVYVEVNFDTSLIFNFQ